jgi:tetratricopeptide (TPR) repeat protein
VAGLVAELLLLYRAAGRPSYRRISVEIREHDTMPDTVSHETVSALLNGTAVPRWTKVECVVRQLASMAVHQPDPESEVRRFHPLWTDADEDRSNHAGGSAPARPAPHPDAFPELSGHDLDHPDTVEVQIGSVPPRNPAFTGRADLLSIIRTQSASEPWQLLVLHGLSGVGKTSVAVEYVHRERERYDVVWWIVAEQPSQARSALVTFGERRGWPTSQDMRQTIQGILSRLEAADFRWLIVFDNAAGPEEIRPLVPAAGGDVIITTRDAAWLDRGYAVPVDVLVREDSIQLLRARGGISFDEADQLAGHLGDLPLALEQAAAMRAATNISVAEYLRRLRENAYAVLDTGRPSGYPETVARAFGVTFAQLRRERAAAAQLLELLSCLSAEPVSLTFLRTADEVRIPPPLGRLLQQDDQLEDAVRLLRRFGLITTIDEGQRVQVHRLVQLIVRDSLSDPDRQSAYDNAAQLLVAANPGNPDDQLSWEMYTQIGPHIGPARLVHSRDVAVRRVVLDHARYLHVIGDFDGSLRLSQEAIDVWTGPYGTWDDDETFACLDRIANALVSLGRYGEAGQLTDRVWDRLNTHEHFGPDHPRTARMANTVAVVRRALGRYGEALRLERYRTDFYQRNGRPSWRDLQQAQNNLAVNLRAVGDFEGARRIDEALVAERAKASGADHYLTLFSASNLARDLYGLGRYQDALALQQEGLPALRLRLGKRHPYVILALRTVALCLRKTGRVAEALDQSREHFQVCRGEFGADHGYTLAAMMTYANSIRAAVAVELASIANLNSVGYNMILQAVNTYRRSFGDRNPLTLAAATNQAAVLRVMGEHIRARRTGEIAYHALNQQLGAKHPYTQAAAVGLANDMVAAQEFEDAAALLEGILETAANAGRTSHPDVLICATNLALITRSGDHEEIQRRVAGLREALGREHPDVIAAGRRQYGECDIEPPPF